MTEAYPLRWPDGWPRTAAAQRSAGNQFGKMTQRPGETWRSRTRVTPGTTYKELVTELARLGAKDVVISSNVPLRQDGNMRADAAERRYQDPGVAAYFTLKGRATVMAQDAFSGLAENMRSLTLAVEALRSLERHGGGTIMHRAFDGFAALPPPAGMKPKRPWWEVLRFPAEPEGRELLSVAEVKARFNTLAKMLHPDAGGDADEMAELNQARDEAEREVQGEVEGE